MSTFDFATASRRLPPPTVDRGRLRFPDPSRPPTPGRLCQGSVFRRHGDPVAGLRENGGLAGDGITQHGETVGGADAEGVEAVEVVDRRFERFGAGYSPSSSFAVR